MLRAWLHAGGRRGCGSHTINVQLGAVLEQGQGRRAWGRGLSPPPPSTARTDTGTCHPQISTGSSWGDRGGKGRVGVPREPGQRGNRDTAEGWGLSVLHLCKGTPVHTPVLQRLPSSGGALCPPAPLDAASAALGDTEAARGGPLCPSCVGTAGHRVPRRRKGSGWDSLPAGSRRKRGRKGLAGAPQRRDVADGTGGGDTGGPRELAHVQGDSSWSPQGRPARSTARRGLQGGWEGASAPSPPMLVPTGLCPLSVTGTHRCKSSLYWRALTRYNSPGGGGAGVGPPRPPPQPGECGAPPVLPSREEGPAP
ncbi:collagen alpha-1(I) chain-like [Onychostruthus taczanowskii]|uniref:collagen alpha-1(I) chain-like n=1 Tax=Onychostruthus taczanowskii TaxID=356909 RepID=UPI001B80C95B|nr:collagen alpha-1(I) chain-like [Onychostruthus taczanowskii]